MTTSYFETALSLHQQGRLDEARDFYLKAIEQAPQHAAAFSNLGALYIHQQQFHLALQAYLRAIELKPQQWDDYLNYALTLFHLDQLDEAIRLCDFVIAQGHRTSHSLMTRAGLLAKQGQYQASVEQLMVILEADPQHPQAQWLLANLWLKQGEYLKAWPLHELRWQQKDFKTPLRHYAQPRWQGQDLRDQTLFIYFEQGLGDTLQFIRFAPIALSKVARVIVQVQSPLVRLVQLAFPQLHVLGPDQPPAEFDVHLPMMSLPLVLGITSDTIPMAAGYLHSPAMDGSRWQSRLAPVRQPLVGLCWRGNPHHQNDRHRSIALSQLIEHLPPNIRYISLQHRPSTSELNLMKNAAIQDVSYELDDFLETAALCAQLDAIVTVDTSVAHLAAALGRKTLILLPHVCDWRWMLERTDSPWYQHAHLYRQTIAGQWQTPLHSLFADLISLLTPHSSCNNNG